MASGRIDSALPLGFEFVDPCDQRFRAGETNGPKNDWSDRGTHHTNEIMSMAAEYLADGLYTNDYLDASLVPASM